jgi:excisionase family DNA binding protein
VSIGDEGMRQRDALSRSVEHNRLGAHPYHRRVTRPLFFGGNRMKAETEFFLVSEAARKLDVAPVTIRSWEKSGKLRAERTGSGFRIFRGEELCRFQELRDAAAERK